MKTKVNVQFLDEKAVMPTRAHETDTGYDLTFIGIKDIKGDTIYFRTGLSVQPEEGYYFEIVPRSSISKLPLQMANSVGVIDEHYRGEILVPIRILHPNIGTDVGRERFVSGIAKIFEVRPNSLYDLANLVLTKKPKLVQMILRKRLDCDFEKVEELNETVRGEGGFGSTDSTTSSKERKQTKKGLVKRVDS